MSQKLMAGEGKLLGCLDKVEHSHPDVIKLVSMLRYVLDTIEHAESCRGYRGGQCTCWLVDVFIKLGDIAEVEEKK